MCRAGWGGGSSAQNQRGGDGWALQTGDPESLGEAPGGGLLDGKARGKGVERTRSRLPPSGLPTFSGALPRLRPS